MTIVCSNLSNPRSNTSRSVPGPGYQSVVQSDVWWHGTRDYAHIYVTRVMKSLTSRPTRILCPPCSCAY